MSLWSGLNRRPTVYDTVALPTELHRQDRILSLPQPKADPPLAETELYRQFRF